MEILDQQGRSWVLLPMSSLPPTNLPRHQNERPKEWPISQKAASSSLQDPAPNSASPAGQHGGWSSPQTQAPDSFGPLYRIVKNPVVQTLIISQVNSSSPTFHPPQLHTCSNLLGRLPPSLGGSLLWFNTFFLSLGSIAFYSIHPKKRILNFNFGIYMLHETWRNRNAGSGEGKHSKKGGLSALPS